jgi:hypothetical protein
MIEIFVLIGWIEGVRTGGVVGQEFFQRQLVKLQKKSMFKCMNSTTTMAGVRVIGMGILR